MVHIDDIQKHHEDSPGNCKKAVDRIKTVIWEKMINQFQTHDANDLLNLSTGETASTLDLIYR